MSPCILPEHSKNCLPAEFTPGEYHPTRQEGKLLSVSPREGTEGTLEETAPELNFCFRKVTHHTSALKRLAAELLGTDWSSAPSPVPWRDTDLVTG